MLGSADPPDCGTILRYVVTQPLDAHPGTKTSYSNFGYCVLGRVVENVSGKSYEQFVRSEVLRRASVRRARLGGARLAARAKGEVRYYGLAVRA